MASRRACTALALSWALLTGFASEAAVTRVGGDALPHLKLAQESRPVLPRRARLTFAVTIGGPAPAREGCALHVGFAHTGTEGTLAFHVALRRSGQRFAQELVRELAAGSGWVDVRIPIAGEPKVTGLRLAVDGQARGGGGVWSQPLVVCPGEQGGRPPPNVLLITLDTLRADRLGAYGNTHALTPRLDQLAREGTLFTDAYASYPNTLVSHATLFTALHPSEHGLLGGSDARLGAAHETLAAALAAAGYATAAFTEDVYLGSRFGFDLGFDRYHDGPEDQEFTAGARSTFQRALEWVNQRPAAPFFLFVQTYQVHTPYAPPADALAQLRARLPAPAGPQEPVFDGLGAIAYNNRALQLTPDQMRWIEGLYDAETWALDRELAAFLDGLRAGGALDSTLVIVISDHGEEFGEHGYMGHGETLHEQALRVPLIFWAPGLVPANKRIDGAVGLVSVAPSIGELIGQGRLLRAASGRSLAHWIAAGASGRPEPVFSELAASATSCKLGERKGPKHTCPYGGVAVRDADYAYIHSAAFGREQLFERRADLYEAHDIAQAHPEVTAKYRALADAYRRRTARAQRRPGRADIDEATKRGLRALGYAQ